RLGWTGPRAMRIPAENEHAAGSSGYWRFPSRAPPPDLDFEWGVDTRQRDGLSPEHEEGTRLWLETVGHILRGPLDITDASLVRSQVTAAIGAVNAQLRADEQRLKAKVQGDVQERLLKAMGEQRRKLARLREAEGQAEGIRLKDLRPSGDESKD